MGILIGKSISKRLSVGDEQIEMISNENGGQQCEKDQLHGYSNVHECEYIKMKYVESAPDVTPIGTVSLLIPRKKMIGAYVMT